MDDLELLKIGMFKLSEAAKRLDALANAAQEQKIRRILSKLSRMLVAYEGQLRTNAQSALPARSSVKE